MKIQIIMFKKLFIVLCLISLLIGNSWLAKGQDIKKDSLYPIREFASLGRMYQRLPLQVNVRVDNSAVPITSSEDTLKADILLYYGKQDFYMQAEGLEQIVNDSIIILVNTAVKQILLYRNSQQLRRNMEISIGMFLLDSSIAKLSARYSGTYSGIDLFTANITLQSRENIQGTIIPKESYNIIYKLDSHETVEFKQVKNKLVPLDAAVFAKFKQLPAYEGILTSSKTSNGELFFLIKSLTTTYKFSAVNYAVKYTPISESDRIVSMGNGQYVPAKGFEQYEIRKEF